MRKLLQINTSVNTGSTGRIAEEIGQYALSKGWESYIAYGRNETPSKSKLIKIGTDLDIKLHVIQTRLFDRHGLSSKISTEKLIEQIKNIKPDVIQLHNLHGYYLNIEILFSFLSIAKIPVFWTLHDCWSMTGHCTYFDFIGCEKWEKECFSCPQKNIYPSSILIDNSKQNYHLKKKLFTSVKGMTIVSVSNWLNNIVKKSFLLNNTLRVIHNGIDTNTFSPTSKNAFREKYNLIDKFVILGVANIWGQRKGLLDFHKISKSINSNFKIVLVGLSSSQMKKLPSNIIGISKTDNILELVSIYSSADVFFNPSVEETFGLTTVEAMSCGTPAIVYNATASPELITPETGFIIEKGDINGVINAIKFTKETGKKNYSIACRNHVIRLYNKKDKLDEYFQLYKNVTEI